MSTNKRNPFIAVFLTLLCPGLGQLYNWQRVKALVMFSLCLPFMVVFVSSLWRLNIDSSLILLPLFTICMYIYAAIDSFIIAIIKKEVPMEYYNRWQYFLQAFLILVLLSIWIINTTGIKLQKSFFASEMDSMAPLIYDGDTMIGDLNFYKTCSPKHGDVIAFKSPVTDKKHINYGKFHICRIIGVPGDNIYIKDKVLYKNGTILYEPYSIFKSTVIWENHLHYRNNAEYQKRWTNQGFLNIAQRESRDNFGPVIVPKNTYFVLNDHRDAVFDSRKFGPVSRDRITQRIIFIYGTGKIERIKHLAEKNKALYLIRKALLILRVA